ncbi:hypothetical protein PUNSTDRAFT_129541 [Punctularia strigosozonata HHB-11173 SS5]|uniref:uncharacterized protein n=1 Tax=Punctularia strigosozonata (strain HHB-11173) TaxID=741275 RepID=UPI000441654C|nr:uncharacterized protein PUNSTDRAFT_129541 [Punctularia strigosozonata HHB-11173 SS5]EIN13872.1 hypothetical protein PUNSTDRAFT_129541 [Punctularia strigosozonata HHB-11173 SS5]
MAQKVRFTPFGIPYVEEFSNVTFKAKPSATPKPPLRPALKTFPSNTSLSNLSNLSSNPKLFPVACDTLAPLDASAGLSVRSPVLEPSARLSRAIFDGTPAGGLYIHFPLRPGGDPPTVPKKTSSSRLRRLRKAIADAVRAAGMDSPPSPAVSNEAVIPVPSIRASVADALAKNGRAGAGGRKQPSLRIDVGRRSVAAPQKPVESQTKRGSLYRGTYGQVCAAIQAAGLDMTPCSDTGFGEATRLGVIFVASNNDQGGVEFRKLTLWG